jgi:hypothetical protein
MNPKKYKAEPIEKLRKQGNNRAGRRTKKKPEED